MIDYQWKIAQTKKPKTVESLANSLNISIELAAMLIDRNINTFDEAKLFFRPSLTHLHSPFLMKDMDNAVARIAEAIDNEENILIFGDYDVDGTTAVSTFYGFLKSYYPNCAFYIPDRYKEGYGISYIGIDFAKDNDFKLIISLDCGVKSVSHIAYAKEKEIDFIICDHHLPGEILPNAVAVLDPKRSDCEYPYKELSGCGVGFKLLQALCSHFEWSTELLFSYLDLVCTSIAADIVPITGENRVLAYYGLQIINSFTVRPGVKALMKVAGFCDENGALKSTLIISNVVFGFAPRINAAGRLAHATAAVELLLAENETCALELAKIVNEHNTNRKDLDSSITTEALELIENDEFVKNASSTVLFKPSWHKGVVGIVASRCIENYYRPTIILTQSGDYAVGSARSVHDFDIHNAIEQCADLLEQFGGHHHAAGLTLKIENVDAFRREFDTVVKSKLTDDQLKPVINIDGVLKISSITPKFYNIIAQMQPFGPGNMQPIFVMHHLVCAYEPKLLKEEHLKITVKQINENAVTLDAIGFRMKDKYELLAKYKTPFSMCFQIEQNTFNGNTTLQLLIRDIKPMGYNPKTIGDSAEWMAKIFLAQKGYKIIEQNFKAENAEIDIIAEFENKTIFVEVKFRKTNYFGFPEENVNQPKQEKIKQAANAYMFLKNITQDIRFEIVAIFLGEEKVEIEHFEDAFY